MPAATLSSGPSTLSRFASTTAAVSGASTPGPTGGTTLVVAAGVAGCVGAVPLMTVSDDESMSRGMIRPSELSTSAGFVGS